MLELFKLKSDRISARDRLIGRLRSRVYGIWVIFGFKIKVALGKEGSGVNWSRLVTVLF